jgi:glyoxylase-like metal-dependent hydrolase (beta-lactamase superfamily II)
MQDERTPVGIADGVYWLSCGLWAGNVYFIRSGGDWFLVDTSVDKRAGAIRRAAEALFGKDEPPGAILLTHVHPDHAGAAPELARSWGCPVYVPEPELPLAVADELATLERFAIPLDNWLVLPLMRALPAERVAAILAGQSLADCARPLGPGDVPGMDGWTAVVAPGHTPGQLTFWRADDGVLLAGDAVLTVDAGSLVGLTAAFLRPNRARVSPPAPYTNRDQQRAVESIAVLAELEPRVLATGHGPPLVDGAGREGRTAALLRRCARRAAWRRRRL